MACCRVCWTRCSAQSRCAKPKLLSLRRQSGGPSGRRQRETGLARPPDRKPDAEVSDQCGLISESDQFRASESWSGSRLFRWSCPGRHAKHRAHNAAAVAGRSLAAFSFLAFGSARAVLTVLPVCGRRNEREHPADAARQSAAASGAGGKLASQSSGAGGTVPKGELQSGRARHLA